MPKICIQTTCRANPKIYAYSTPEIQRHNGWLKIGYTEQDVRVRIAQQTQTADVIAKLEWDGDAIYKGSEETFMDKDFHAYLRKLDVPWKRDTEWFQISRDDSYQDFEDFRVNRGLVGSDAVVPYTLRTEQAAAVLQTMAYREQHPEGAEFLWNAKPRFGKTLAVYDFIQRIGAEMVLIVTNRPAIANSWYEDYEKFVGTQTGWRFVSETDSLKWKPLVRTRSEFLDEWAGDESLKIIEFVSLQDLKGSRFFGGDYDKLEEIAHLIWDVLVVDETHEGVDTYRTDAAFDQIQRRFTLHLSGTPFKALANDKFPQEAIFNWTYQDEQTARRNWDPERGTNPYEVMPRLNLFTYQMSEIIRDRVEQGIELDGETEDFAFDLNEFFRAENGRFVHDKEVDRFLDTLTTGLKYPFSTPELRKELRHTFWLLDRVESARLLAGKLQKHPVFKDYEIVLAAGDGKLDDESETGKAFNRVKRAIEENDKTITLSVGQLTTGVTIPEWTGVLILSNMASPALYMQAAFRAQNPCLFQEGNEFLRKENAYVFDFDPARTLTIYERFANGLAPGGGGDSEACGRNVRELLNFFPVIGEDENGEMIELDAEKVLTIPRKIRSKEVVRCGFMCDFLFQNIHNIFHAPAQVLEILETFTPCKEPQRPLNVTPETGRDLSLNERGDVELDNEWVIGRSTELFGEKIVSITPTVEDEIEKALADADLEDKKVSTRIKETLVQTVVQPLIEEARNQLGDQMTKGDQREIEAKLKKKMEEVAEKTVLNTKISQGTPTPENLHEALSSQKEDLLEASAQLITQTVETNQREREKRNSVDSVRDHLRGFARTIPSFLMAYGDDSVTLETFDQIIPEDVFLEVTSITLDQFRFLRDGGDYTDQKTGETEHFEGHLFDEIVFNDSVNEFLRLREQLANYFDEKSEGDIFDYIPPQKTNQIFTPKRVVKEMVDLLEQENPGCFDDPDKTFIDLYMKSGLYIAEIVKRLYRSPKMKKRFPNDSERLEHIFTKQVYGLAPTQIIHAIATHFLLGFAEGQSFEHNFRCKDSLELIKNEALEEFLDETFGE